VRAGSWTRAQDRRPPGAAQRGRAFSSGRDGSTAASPRAQPRPEFLGSRWHCIQSGCPLSPPKGWCPNTSHSPGSPVPQPWGHCSNPGAAQLPPFPSPVTDAVTGDVTVPAPPQTLPWTPESRSRRKFGIAVCRVSLPQVRSLWKPAGTQLPRSAPRGERRPRKNPSGGLTATGVSRRAGTHRSPRATSSAASINN